MDQALLMLLIGFVAFLLCNMVAGTRFWPANSKAVVVSGLFASAIPAILANIKMFEAGIRSPGVPPGVDRLVGYFLLGVVSWIVAVVISRRLDKTRLRERREHR